jgi:hypothetical protein
MYAFYMHLHLISMLENQAWKYRFILQYYSYMCIFSLKCRMLAYFLQVKLIRKDHHASTVRCTLCYIWFLHNRTLWCTVTPDLQKLYRLYFGCPSEDQDSTGHLLFKWIAWLREITENGWQCLSLFLCCSGSQRIMLMTASFVVSLS